MSLPLKPPIVQTIVQRRIYQPILVRHVAVDRTILPIGTVHSLVQSTLNPTDHSRSYQRSSNFNVDSWPRESSRPDRIKPGDVCILFDAVNRVVQPVLVTRFEDAPPADPIVASKQY